MCVSELNLYVHTDQYYLESNIRFEFLSQQKVKKRAVLEIRWIEDIGRKEGKQEGRNDGKKEIKHEKERKPRKWLVCCLWIPWKAISLKS